MKRVDLIRHLERYGIEFLREGGSHSVYVNRVAGKTSTVPAIERSTISSHRRSVKI
jgi:predicted RNA binding protein YcfA (HicA-like mRNA interferase family)